MVSRELHINAVIENLSDVEALQTSYYVSITCKVCGSHSEFVISSDPQTSSHNCTSCRGQVDFTVHDVVHHLGPGNPITWVRVESSAEAILNIRPSPHLWSARTVQHDTPTVTFNLDHTHRFRGMKIYMRLECSVV